MPFPFRNPIVNDDDSDDNGQQQVDPKLESIVQKMINAGEPEENIALVIKNYKPGVEPATKGPTPTSPPPNPNTEWWKGFGGSLFGGEAGKASEQGLLGWGKGAIADIPSTVMGGLKTIGGLVTNPSETMSDIGSSLKALPGQVVDTTKKAGADPYAFGEMVGQMGGQPLMMDMAPGMIKAAAPTVLPAVGKGMQAVGDFVSKNQPVTGILPFNAAPRTLRLMEKGVGKVTSKIGDLLAPDEPTPPVVEGTPKTIKPIITRPTPSKGRATLPLPDKVQPPGYGIGDTRNADVKDLMTDSSNPQTLDFSSLSRDSAGNPKFNPDLSKAVQKPLDLSGSSNQIDLNASPEQLNMSEGGPLPKPFNKPGTFIDLTTPVSDSSELLKSRGFKPTSIEDMDLQSMSDSKLNDLIAKYGNPEYSGPKPTSSKPDIPSLQKKSVAIQDNINKKYGGDTSKASPSTQNTLSKIKQQIPVINRPGTYITIKNPTFDMIKQAQRLGYQFDSKTAEGGWRMIQTGKPLLVNSSFSGGLIDH